jgi:hypothetical protein
MGIVILHNHNGEVARACQYPQSTYPAATPGMLERGCYLGESRIWIRWRAFAQHLRDVPPEEVTRAAAAMFGGEAG